MNKKQAAEVLELFVELSDSAGVEIDIRLEKLFKALHRAGVIALRDHDTPPSGYRTMIRAGLRHMAGEKVSIDISASVLVAPYIQHADWRSMVVVGSPVGLLFCLRYAVDVAGVIMVKTCPACGKIIFAKHGRAKYCVNNEKCKNRYNYLKRKGEAKK